MLKIGVGLLFLVALYGGGAVTCLGLERACIVLGYKMGAQDKYDAEKAGYMVFFVVILILVILAVAYGIGDSILS